ncbi:FISUMP domain-containing protein [Saccharicrinis aurantiacus]|uniref:T9SS type A sorting domain-containing protein n=1 Tax=Saccharicrinis aurantiacus TaxID=1849719 RepID=UPI00248FA695|nr:FISUMP domain-containing protein [Saccharicrinis aurantiacus]
MKVKQLLLTLLTIASITPLAAQEGTVIDIDGNEYSTKVFGSTEWMTENLKVTKYNDGTPIDVADGFFDFKDDPTYTETYGKLYSWDVAVSEKNVCPSGWELPSFYDFLALAKDIMGEEYDSTINMNGTDIGSILVNGAGYELKSTSYWKSGEEGTNSSGFNVLATGFRNRYNGTQFTLIDYRELDETARFWCTERMRPSQPWTNARMAMVITNRDYPSDKSDNGTTPGMAVPNSANMWIAGCHHTEGQSIRCKRKQVSTNIPDQIKLRHRAYPNPASSFFILETNLKVNGSLSIYNSMGTPVKFLQLNQNSQHIDVSNLIPGIYICEISQESQRVSSFKLIVK